MDVKRAAENTLLIWRKKAGADGTNPEIFEGEAEQSEEGLGLMHQRWLLEQVIADQVNEQKAHRWLSYAQGFLVRDGVITLYDCRMANLMS